MRRMFSENQIQGFVKNTKKDIATLVDANGNDRFVEGDITMETIEGVTQTYGKWSLSGTHLLIVLCFDVANTTEFTSSTLFASITNVPEWIMNKITPVFGYGGIIRQAVVFYAKNTTASQNGACFILKDGTALKIQNSTGITMTDDRATRIQFDLLIDNE